MKTNETLKLLDSESEKEIAAKALECGYLRKNGNTIEPQIILIDRKNEIDFYNLSFDFNNDMGTVIEQIAAELSVFMKTHIPEHLMNSNLYGTYCWSQNLGKSDRGMY